MMITLTSSDGHNLDCWMGSATSNRIGGLVILQEIFGVTDQLKGLAARYAKLGYDVAISALFDRQQRGAVISFDNAIPGRDLMLSSDLEQTMMDIDAAVLMLSDKGGKVAVMGFCWGGGLAIRAAQKFDIAGAVSFYGTRLPQYQDCPLKAPVLGHFGELDDYVPEEMLNAAKAYFDDFHVHTYDAGHAFANDARPDSYSEADAQLAHERTQKFLQSILAV